MMYDDDNSFKSYTVQRGGAWMTMEAFAGYRAWNKVLYTYIGSELSFPRETS